VTQPSQFTQEVAKATNVPSKGGPPVEELSASTKKGPIGPLKKPQDTTSTTTPPEQKLAPTLGGGAWTLPEQQPGTSVTPPSTSGNVTTATAPTTTTDQGQPSAGQQSQQPQVPPIFQQNPDRMAFVQKYLKGPQDYSIVPPFITHDENFAGLNNGIPVFLSPDNRVYMKDDTGPGEETRHFADAQFGTEAAKNGVKVQDAYKANIARGAQQRMQALLQTQDAIDRWQAQLKQFRDGGNDENWMQRQALQALMNGKDDAVSNAFKGLAQITQGMTGVNQPMEDLDGARANVANTYAQATNNVTPSNPAVRTTLNLPTTGDDFATQQSKVRALQAQIAAEAHDLQIQYPFGTRDLESLLTRIGQRQPLRQPGAQQGATQTQTRPAPSGQPTREEAQAAPQLRAREDIGKYPSGTLVRDTDGKLKRIP
jgi:hypothetical protein